MKDTMIRRAYKLRYRLSRKSKRPLALDLDAFVQENRVSDQRIRYSIDESMLSNGGLTPARESSVFPASPENMESVFKELDRFRTAEEKKKTESFSQRLQTLIREKGFTETQVYKAAHVDRKLFSKIATKPDYSLSKNTAMSLALGLHLDFEEAQDLIGRAGYSFSRAIRKDVILEYFFRKRYYNIMDINTMLVLFGERTLDGR